MWTYIENEKVRPHYLKQREDELQKIREEKEK
jgi:hypothetical protein